MRWVFLRVAAYNGSGTIIPPPVTQDELERRRTHEGCDQKPVPLLCVEVVLEDPTETRCAGVDDSAEAQCYVAFIIFR